VFAELQVQRLAPSRQAFAGKSPCRDPRHPAPILATRVDSRFRGNDGTGGEAALFIGTPRAGEGPSGVASLHCQVVVSCFFGKDLWMYGFSLLLFAICYLPFDFPLWLSRTAHPALSFALCVLTFICGSAALRHLVPTV